MQKRRSIPPLLFAVLVLVLASGLTLGPGDVSADGESKPGPSLHAGELSEGEKNYFILRKVYTKWHEGLFGSRKFYERKLLRLLYGMIGKEITTGYDYMLVSPEGVFDKTVSCNLQTCRWLHIHGALDAVSVKNAIGSDGSVLRKWWRSGILVAVSGRLKRFKLDRDAGGDVIQVYFDKVRLLK
jgi:hypothetical protein